MVYFGRFYRMAVGIPLIKKTVFYVSYRVKDGFKRMLRPIKSGRRDSNTRPPAPKAGTLTGLRYAPNILGFMRP